VTDVQVTGHSYNRVDWLIIGDGYTAAQQTKFTSDARNLFANFFAISLMLSMPTSSTYAPCSFLSRGRGRSPTLRRWLAHLQMQVTPVAATS